MIKKDDRTEYINIDSINEGERARKDYKDLKPLEESIQEKGVINGIAVKVHEKGFLLLAGGRRLRASKNIGLKRIPAIVYPADITNLEIREIEFEENYRREDLEYAEQVALLKRIHNLQEEISLKRGKKWSMGDTAKLMNVSHATLTQDMQLAEAIEAVPQLGHLKNKREAVKTLERIGDNVHRRKVAKRIREERSTTPVDRQRKKLEDSYMVKDFFEGIKTIPDGSVDFIDLDPDWAIDFEKNDMDMESSEYTGIDVKDFPEFMSRVLKECTRVMSSRAWMVIWYGSEWYKLIQDLLKEYNLRVEPVPAIWLKKKGQNRAAGYKMSRGYEAFMYARKSEARLNKKGRSNVFEGFPQPKPGKRVHPTEKPIELYNEILDTFMGDLGVICAPFLGSGNLLLSGANKGHSGFGFDLGKEYKDRYTENVEASEPGKYTSYDD